MSKMISRQAPPPSSEESAAPKVIRCAIYTRKSTEEGLDQEFNSLDAQREAAQAYIASQKHEGWVCLPERYDDGGYSGGNIERPALQRLVADIELGKIDCVVVYKVDRLSRSLLDFSGIMGALDRQRVSFVSVTQQFNTTSSMGRLTLNILLSFAQFEREIIAERIRDKMSAARRKGKWVGGTLVMGYDVAPEGKRLVINEEEAERVRQIFQLYLEKQSLLSTAQELNRRGWLTKGWITKKGKPHPGRSFDKSNVHSLVTNVIYLGKVNHKGKIFDGEHGAIVPEALWQEVQDSLQRNGRSGGSHMRNKYGALLKGLLYCQPCNAAMFHTYTARKGRNYRYYVCLKAQKQGWKSCPSKSVPAEEMEQFVVRHIRRIASDADLRKQILQQLHQEAETKKAEMQSEQWRLLADLKRAQAEIGKLILPAATIGPQESIENTRLAELQEKTAQVETRLSELREALAAIESSIPTEAELDVALRRFDPIWNALAPGEQARVIALLIEKIGYNGSDGTITISFHPSGLSTIALDDVHEDQAHAPHH